MRLLLKFLSLDIVSLMVVKFTGDFMGNGRVLLSGGLAPSKEFGVIRWDGRTPLLCCRNDDAEIKTLSPWQETLWLACCPTFSVGETSIHPEASPILECVEGINTHCDPQRESCPLVGPLSGWNIICHNGLDMSLGPNFEPDFWLSSRPSPGLYSGIPHLRDT